MAEIMTEEIFIDEKVNDSQKIGESTFTVRWLLESLRENDEKYKTLHGNRAVKEISTKDISEGKGFISTICQCTIKFVDSNSEADIYSTILKIPGFSGIEKSLKQCGGKNWFDDDQKQTLTKLHNNERSFYYSLASIIDVPTPKVYKTVEWIYMQQEGCIHMEDMSNVGKTISYFDNINLTHIKCFIQHVAHWHKNILCTDPKLWKGKISSISRSFQQANISFQKLGESFAETSPLKGQLQPYLEKFRHYCYNIDHIIAASKDTLKEIETVVVHGDMHSGNIMWASDANGNIENKIAAFVDWQTIREGSPMEDLARFLIMCADGVVRRQAEEFAIQYYFDCLSKEFGNAEKVPYSIEQLQKAYNYAFVIESLKKNGLGVVPFFLGTINDSTDDNAVKPAYRDYGTLKVLHLYEDLDKLLFGEMKAIFDVFGTKNL